MATVTTRYRCPVTPEECPTSPRRGFCQVHEWERLVPERVYLANEGGTGTESGQTVETAAGTGSGRTAGTGSATTTTDAPADRGDHRASPAEREDRTHPSTGGDRGPASPYRDGTRPGQHPAARASDGAPPGGPATPVGRPRGAAAPPTRVQPKPAPGLPPHRPEPELAPVVPGLALVMCGALVPVRAADRGRTPLGRDAPDCAHVPGLAALDQVSRLHAEVYWDGGRLCVADTGSRNGTFVDGRRITGPVQLWPGAHRLHLAQDPEAVVVELVELDAFGAPR